MPEFSLPEYLERRRSEVDAALGDLLPSEDTLPQKLHEAMRYAVFAGGKRLRPILVLAGCEAAGGKSGECMPMACAVELIHTYSLVHDDLPALDDDDLRRGRPTVHRAYDEATAILVGDALLTFAFEVALRPAAAPADSKGATAAEVRLQALEVLLAAIGTHGMIGGQMLDLLATGEALDESSVRAIHERKTGALLRACPVIGGILAGASDTVFAALDAYGADLGLAFQIVDDILDIEGTRAVLGKSVGKDAAVGKATFPAAIGLEPSRRLAGELAGRAARAAERLGPAARPLAALAEYAVRRER